MKQITKNLLSGLATKYALALDYLESLLEKEGVSYDQNDLMFDIDNAWRAISTYLWVDYENNADYSTIIITLAQAYVNNSLIKKGILKGDKQITQQSQGSRSVTFKSSEIALDNNGFTTEVKASLPPRKLRVM